MKIEAQKLFQVEPRSQNISASVGASSRYHRAAIDGYVDMLCDASKRDTNLSNEDDGLTPTLLAAQSGHLDALRILVGRGGDPEKCASDGSSALHLAATWGHLNCVSFLVNFGVNMWSLDNDLHTAKDVAAIKQRKDVLDFLDLVMAKQSALNTKNVQKLKEKAKLAAEKRIKQMRKAQLKAIKQVEKDERYLKKLSHNRRLLKGAHSISDIKLVGRHQTRASNYLSSGELAGDGSISASSRLSSSPSLANLLNHKLQMDLIGRNSMQQHQVGGLKLLSRRSTGTGSSSTTDESSACSTASVSSYLSSTGRISPKRPKYSDLVAVQGFELARWQRNKPASGVCSTEQQSIKSTSTGSTLGTKFWGIGGVSRKVQLRRLLKAGAQSSSDLAATSQTNSGQRDASGDLAASTASTSESSAKVDIDKLLKEAGTSSRFGLAGKLCNVQPTMRLKLNTNEPARAPSRAESSGDNNNKWSARATRMTRAVSEPDFGAALRSATSGEEDSDSDENSDANLVESNRNTSGSSTGLSSMGPTESSGSIRRRVSGDETSSEKQCQSEGNNAGNEQQVSSSNHNRAARKEGSLQQHQLLNQCLSQLKLRHEELTMRNRDELYDHNQSSGGKLLGAPKCAGQKATVGAGSQHISSGIADLFSSSDELIKHQLMAGEFPLRPSLIKQKQLLTKDHQIRACQKKSANGSQHQDRKMSGGGSTTISVDSIGSAGSFAKRDACSASESAKSTSDLSSSVLSYPTSSSCSASSIEVAAAGANTEDENGTGSPIELIPSGVSQGQHPVSPPPPLPPPLPPKTLSLATIKCCLANQKLSQQQQRGLSSNCQRQPNMVPEFSTIERFLESNGLEDLSEVFAREKIDLEALALLTEEDLKSLNILLGPRRKLLKAIATRRRRAKAKQEDTNNNNDFTKPMYIMVDTQL